MLLELLVAFLALALLVLLWKYWKLKEAIHDKAVELFSVWREKELEKASMERAALLFERWKREAEERIRRDAIQRSKAVVLGKVTEHLMPFLPGFKYNPKDARFLGTPVDLVVFDGLDEGEIRRIVFVEVKTGKSTLSKREREVKKAVEGGMVYYEVVTLSKEA